MTAQCFTIEPFQVTAYRASLDTLEARFANYYGGLTHNVRLISRTRRFSFTPRRPQLRLRTLPLDDVREVLPILDTAIEQGDCAGLADAIAVRRDGLLTATARLRDAPAVATALVRMAAGTTAREDMELVRDGCRRAVWPWRWLKNHQRLYDTLEQHTPPLTIDHYFLCWPDDYVSADAIGHVLTSTFLLPNVERTPLPALFDGEYTEEADYVAPTQPGQPYMTVLVAWDIRGTWDLTSLHDLLMSEYELAIAIDIRTMPRAKAQRRTQDAVTVLKEAVFGKFAVADARTRRAYDSAQAALHELDVQSLHEVSYAILLQAPTLALLRQQAETLRALLGLRLQLEQMRGAQLDHLRLFTTQPTSAITTPLVWRNTLSSGVADVTPWGYRKTSRLDGTLWGFDPHEGMPIHFNVWGDKRVENAHLTAMGRPGSGKTVSLNTLAARQAAQGDQVIMFDPVGKCQWLCDAVGPGATYINVATDAAINILDPLSAEMGRQASHVARKLSILLGRAYQEGDQVRFAARDLNFEYGALDRALQDDALYGANGARLVDMHERGSHASPRLEQLVHALRRVAQRTSEHMALAAATLAEEIDARLLGSRAHLFNTPTTFRWDFGSDVVAYDLQHADRELLPLYYDHGFEALNRWVRDPQRRQRQQGLITIFDEFKFMASVPSLEQYVAMATKTWRNYQATMWTADQNATTYFGQAGAPSTWGPFISNNTLIKMFFRQEGSEADMIGAAYRDQLAPEHIEQIKMSGTGEAIVMFDDEVHTLVFQLTDQEAYYFARS